MRATIAIGVCPVLLILAGCASGATDTSGSAPLAEATTTVSETPAVTPSAAAPLSPDEAAQQYLKIVRPYNEALEDLEQAINGGESLEAVTALAEAVADANVAHVEELADTHWPAEVESAIEELIAESTAAQEYWDDAAEAGTYDEFIDAVLAAGEHDGVVAAGTIRDLLNLDEYDERDYD